MSVDYASNAETDLPARPIWRSMLRGARLTCPSCGEGRLFASYLKVAPTCASCGEELHHQRADDAPTYIVITIVAHVVVAALLWTEVAYQPPMWMHMAIWLPLTVLLSLALLPPVKGALIGLQWALRMHGFGEDDSVADGGLKPEIRA